MFTARQGTHLLDFGGEGSAHAPTFPAAAGATNVGGQGAHWTCAIPRPAFSEKVPFIADDEWEDLITTAEGLLHAQSAAFADSAVGGGIRSLLEEEFAGELPDGYGPSTLPVAGDPQPDGTMRWAGADVVLGPLIEPGNPLAERFELRDLTLVRRVEHDGDVVTGVTVEDLRTHETSFVPADLVVVAADAFRSPQLLWASGIRPTRARALPHGASGRDLDGRARCRPDRPIRDRGAARRGARPPGDERGRPGRRGQPHSVLGARPPVLAPGDVLRDDAVPDGAGRPVRPEPLGLREHGLRHAQAPALRATR